MSKLVLTGVINHSFTYVDEDGTEQQVTVNKGQDVLPLGLPDNVVAQLKKEFRGSPRRPILYYLEVQDDESIYQRGEEIISWESATKKPVEAPKLPEVDPDDPGAELARELAEEDRRAAEEERKKAAAAAKAEKPEAAPKKASTTRKATTTKTKNGE